jgi:hypothetical protein
MPSPEHLRKYALCKTGYCDTATYVADNRKRAVEIGVFCRKLDSFAVIEIKDNVVMVHTAKSQSGAAMKKHEFEASKKAVLEFLRSHVGVTAKDSRRSAGRSA